jgi:site-specific DNA-cytosine methylase
MTIEVDELTKLNRKLPQGRRKERRTSYDVRKYMELLRSMQFYYGTIWLEIDIVTNSCPCQHITIFKSRGYSMDSATPHFWGIY